MPDKAGASLRYTVTVWGDTIAVRHIVAGDRGGLALVPGRVSGDGSLACLCQGEGFAMPSCTSWLSGRTAVSLEESGSRLCDDEVGQPVWTSTAKQADRSAAHAGEAVTYTITFTNHSPCALEGVRICDTVPAEVAVVPGSIQPAPGPGETLQTGILMGRIAAKQSAVLRYRAIVGPGAWGEIVNRARAEYCYVDCMGCCRHGTGGLISSVVQILPGEARIALAKSADKASVCLTGEEITYTLIVSNSGDVPLADVIAVDPIPRGLCYQEGSTSINGGSPVNENPHNGIALGALEPGESRKVTFALTVCIEPCYSELPINFVNTAAATGHAGTTAAIAESNPVAVIMSGCCACRWVHRRFPIGDFCRFRYCYVYNLGTVCHNTRSGGVITARFGVAVKYVDCDGQYRGRSYEGTVVYRDLPEATDPDSLSARFSDLVCRIDRCGNIAACFRADLHCRRRKQR